MMSDAASIRSISASANSVSPGVESISGPKVTRWPADRNKICPGRLIGALIANCPARR